MPIPDFQSCMKPLLQAVADGQVYKTRDAYNTVCEHFQLTQDELGERLPSGKQTVIKNRLAWARTYMTKAGLLIAPARAQLQITDLGVQALNSGIDKINVKYLKQYPEFVAFHTSKPKTSDTQSQVTDDESETDPLERLEQAHQEILSSLADDILQTIKSLSPQFLEKSVVELMQAMGYGGWSKESGKATQYTSDDGIDGVINDDPLGLDTIYIQAKRYSDTVVHRPEIDKFIGALTRQGARKGVFITTSTFSSGAIEAAKGLNMSITLIDGQLLAALMIKHGLGVQAKNNYQVSILDTEYFTED